MYRLLRPLIFTLPPEDAHHASLCALRAGILPRHALHTSPRLTQRLWNLSFLNPVGMAAGFDKNAQVIDGLSAQGFGFIECGTVTPRPQSGNPKPRIFRLPKEQAVINRLGFNNDGLDAFQRNLSSRKSSVIVGGNIGKNKDSADAVADYVTGLRALYRDVDYITVNISSPNTPGLRDLQAEESLRALVKALHAERAQLDAAGATHKPILVKIAPDLEQASLEMIADLARSESIDGLIVSNTTITRPGVSSAEQGGLSGVPLRQLSTQVLAAIARATKGSVPLIGVGGITSAEDAYEKILNGASLVQLYTAFIYQGFGLASRIARELDALLERDGFVHMSDAVGKKL